MVPTRERALELVAHPIGWQRVLHGEQMELRQVVCGVLLETKGVKLAFRYACCGVSDQVVKGPTGVHVAPRGCGHRLCPRCGRRRGAKYARRIMGWLGYHEHGDLWSVVLTQQVRSGESLADARARMAPKQRRYMRWLTRLGLIGAMTTVHVVWSKGGGGWHYHVHVLVEMPLGSASRSSLLDGWSSCAGGEYIVTEEEQCRLVLAAGPAVAELRDDGGDADFWQESHGPVAKAVQYPMRDMAQGVSAWRLGGDLERVREAATELQRSSSGWKLFRAWGRWRKLCPAAVAAEEVKVDEVTDGTDSEKSAPPCKAEGVGTVHRLWKEARAGNAFARSVFEALEPTVRNASEFAKRFVKYCRLASTGPPSAQGACHG